MPRPLSRTRTPSSSSRVTSMRSQWPASASSTELSTTSWTRWCRPRSDVDPMYMPGRLRTASRPSSTWMELPVYSCLVAFCGLAVTDNVTFLAARVRHTGLVTGKKGEVGHVRHKRGADDVCTHTWLHPGGFASV